MSNNEFTRVLICRATPTSNKGGDDMERSGAFPPMFRPRGPARPVR